MGNASAGGVSHCALLAEPDRALRDLMHRALVAASYDVVDSSNALHLEVELRARAVYEANNVLFVFAARLAAQCSPFISVVARERARMKLPPAQVILTFELGTLATLSRPQLGACVTRASLEKPFDLLELQIIAWDCWRGPLTSGASGDAARGEP